MALPEEHAYLRGRVGWKLGYRLDPTKPDLRPSNQRLSLLNWNVDSNDQEIFPRTQVSPGVSRNEIVSVGMPASIVGFGNHELILSVSPSSGNTEDSQKAYFQVFFRAGLHNNPGQTLPNWYYYYYQLIANKADFYPQLATYQPGSVSAGGATGYTIRDDAHASAHRPMRIFALTHTTPEDSPTIYPTGNKVIPHGYLHIGGIHWSLYVAAHEAGHVYYMGGNVPGVGMPNSFPPGNGPNEDFDQDGLTNDFEMKWGLNYELPDSTGSYGGWTGGVQDSNVGDQQFLADVYAWGLLKTYKSAWIYDWADDGLNAGQHANPYDPAAAIFFPWWYEEFARPGQTTPPALSQADPPISQTNPPTTIISGRYGKPGRTIIQ